MFMSPLWVPSGSGLTTNVSLPIRRTEKSTFVYVEYAINRSIGSQCSEQTPFYVS